MDQGIMKLWERLTKAMESFDSHVAWVGEEKRQFIPCKNLLFC